MKRDPLKEHEKYQGKWAVTSKVPLESREDLAIFYSPGVAEPSLAIKADKSLVNKYTSRKNVVAVISDGSAVLGLGNIGPEAAIPVMEGKSVLFKKFANIDSLPIVLKTQDSDEIVQTIINISPSFGGINLEDISAPKAIEIERRLIKALDIPVFHDDQHGTAIVVSAAFMNASKLTGRKIEDLKVFMIGLGAAGTSVARMIKELGVKRIWAYDKDGYIFKGRANNNFVLDELLDDKIVNSFPDKSNDLSLGFKETDVLIGLSAPNIVSKKMITLMNEKPWVFTLANPDPEIKPELAKEAGAYIIGTGRSDYPNQINNLLAFPGIFKGALQSNLKKIDDKVKMAAAKAIAMSVSDEELSRDFIVPNTMDVKVPERISKVIMEYNK